MLCRPSSQKLGTSRKVGQDTTGGGTGTRRRLSLVQSMQNRLSFNKSSPSKLVKSRSEKLAGRFAKEDITALVEWGSDSLWDRVIMLLKNHNMWLLICITVLSFTEDAFMNLEPQTMNVFYLLLELISGYANSGISIGVPGQSYSLSGALSTMGTLVIIFAMFLGKHRGMPVIDFKFRAIQGASIPSYE